MAPTAQPDAGMRHPPSSSGPAATCTEGLNIRKVATRACLSVNVMVTLLWDLTLLVAGAPG